MQEKIVYFLGAGFSAPLGLPVMAGFLISSKDLYFSDIIKYKHFGPVLQTIERMGKAKNYYNIDLFNIEEILSILEMEKYIASSRGKRAYLIYIRDVIMALTPAFKAQDAAKFWPKFDPATSRKISNYAAFVANLFGLECTNERFATSGNSSAIFSKRIDNRSRYSVITLNYDLVLENAVSLINEALFMSDPLKFATTVESAKDPLAVPLAKLHGSVCPLTIVPPTWNKGANPKVRESWKLAYKLLVEASQIRFIGYSLPTADSYVRYLLSSAVLSSKHLKAIDSICLDDSSGSVELRFRDLIKYYRFRFKKENALNYLQEHHSMVEDSVRKNQTILGFNRMEFIHDRVMAS